MYVNLPVLLTETLIDIACHGADVVRSVAIAALAERFDITARDAHAVCESWIKRPGNEEAAKYIVRIASRLDNRVEIWKRVLGRGLSEKHLVSAVLEIVETASAAELCEIAEWIEKALMCATPKELETIVSALANLSAFREGGNG